MGLDGEVKQFLLEDKDTKKALVRPLRDSTQVIIPCIGIPHCFFEDILTSLYFLRAPHTFDKMLTGDELFKAMFDVVLLMLQTNCVIYVWTIDGGTPWRKIATQGKRARKGIADPSKPRRPRKAAAAADGDEDGKPASPKEPEAPPYDKNCKLSDEGIIVPGSSGGGGMEQVEKINPMRLAKSRALRSPLGDYVLGKLQTGGSNGIPPNRMIVLQYTHAAPIAIRNGGVQPLYQIRHNVLEADLLAPFYVHAFRNGYGDEFKQALPWRIGTKDSDFLMTLLNLVDRLGLDRCPSIYLDLGRNAKLKHQEVWDIKELYRAITQRKGMTFRRWAVAVAMLGCDFTVKKDYTHGVGGKKFLARLFDDGRWSNQTSDLPLPSLLVDGVGEQVWIQPSPDSTTEKPKAVQEKSRLWKPDPTLQTSMSIYVETKKTVPAKTTDVELKSTGTSWAPLLSVSQARARLRRSPCIEFAHELREAKTTEPLEDDAVDVLAFSLLYWCPDWSRNPTVWGQRPLNRPQLAAPSAAEIKEQPRGGDDEGDTDMQQWPLSPPKSAFGAQFGPYYKQQADTMLQQQQQQADMAAFVAFAVESPFQLEASSSASRTSASATAQMDTTSADDFDL